MKARFDYERKPSLLLNSVKRPVVKVSFWSKKLKKWFAYTLIVDTGADYTVLPKYFASELKINLKKECSLYEVRGIGGRERVYFLKKKARIKIGCFENRIPMGFLNRDNITPILGRYQCLDKFSVLFADFKTEFRREK